MIILILWVMFWAGDVLSYTVANRIRECSLMSAFIPGSGFYLLYKYGFKS